MFQLFPDPTACLRLPWMLAALFVLSLALPLRADEPPSEPPPNVPPQTGMASWHGGDSRTASGRRWKSEELIAAHRTLPLGSAVRVINTRNGREAVVLITDRGPYSRGRIIDLSVAAARQIGCLEAGTAPVRLEVVRLARFHRVAAAHTDTQPPG